MMRIVLFVLLAAGGAGCARSYVRVHRAGGDRLNVELVVHEGFVYARFYELMDALAAAQDPRWHRGDCAFRLEVWDGAEPIRVWTENKRELDVKSADLGLTPVCGPGAGALLTNFVSDHGVVFYSGHGQVSTRRRPSRGGGGVPELGDSMEAAFDRAVELAGTPHPSVIYEGEDRMLASDILRTAAELVRHGARVLVTAYDDSWYAYFLE